VPVPCVPWTAVALHQLSGFQHQRQITIKQAAPLPHTSISTGRINTDQDTQQVLGVFDRALSVLSHEECTLYTPPSQLIFFLCDLRFAAALRYRVPHPTSMNRCAVCVQGR